MNYSLEEAKILVEQFTERTVVSWDDRVHILHTGELGTLTTPQGEWIFFADNITIAGDDAGTILRYDNDDDHQENTFDNAGGVAIGNYNNTFKGIPFNTVQSISGTAGSVTIIAYKFYLQ